MSRFWLAHELAMVRRLYWRVPAGVIAATIGRSRRAVSQRASLLGLARPRRRATDQDRETITRMAADGACNRCIGRACGLDRHAVARIRREIGARPLEVRGSVGTCRQCVERVRAATREQCRRAGVASLAEIRIREFRRFAEASGWPADLRPRAIQMLDALWELGPMTRRQIAAAIGMPWKGSRDSLTSNDPEGSYLAHLMARGLVMQVGRCIRGDGPGRNVYLYSLAPGVVLAEEDAEREKRAGPCRPGDAETRRKRRKTG